jgi:pimeloyl-ACP methyl ester carboxylesterase
MRHLGAHSLLERVCIEYEPTRGFTLGTEGHRQHGSAGLPAFDYQGEACDDFHPYRASMQDRRAVEGHIPTLIRSGPFDPVTPPEYGDRIARSLSVVRHIRVPASSHTMDGAGVFCLVSIMRAFWQAPHTAPPQDCVENRAAIAFATRLPDWAR